MTPPILITGATGFLGKHLVSLLRDSGEPLRILNYGPCPWKSGDGMEILDGNVLWPEDVNHAMAGCRQRKSASNTSRARSWGKSPCAPCWMNDKSRNQVNSV